MGGGSGDEILDFSNYLPPPPPPVATKGSIIAEVSLEERTRSYPVETARHLANAITGQLERTVLSAKASS